VYEELTKVTPLTNEKNAVQEDRKAVVKNPP